MAAPTNAAFVKKGLANSEPSTHGPKPTSRDVCDLVAIRWNRRAADIVPGPPLTRFRTWAAVANHGHVGSVTCCKLGRLDLNQGPAW